MRLAVFSPAVPPDTPPAVILFVHPPLAGSVFRTTAQAVVVAGRVVDAGDGHSPVAAPVAAAHAAVVPVAGATAVPAAAVAPIAVVASAVASDSTDNLRQVFQSGIKMSSIWVTR